jgi:Domain of unknown function (DUF4105)
MRWLKATARICAVLAMAVPAVWGAFALWYQLPGGQVIKVLGVALWCAFSVAMLVMLFQGRVALGLIDFVIAFMLLLVWWHYLPASNDRVWSDDVAQMTTGVVSGDRVTLHNVRNFDWRSNTDYTQRWETRSYDLNRLTSVDMILSYWAGPAIAHTLVSFGFDDGERVAFSVEIRRERGEEFSEIGGFFKEFELSILAADERDVIRVRTNVRGEDDYLYHVQMAQPAIRSLFLAYIAQANDLIATPRFYNTVTDNCTTLIYHMMKRIVGHLPLSYRLLLSGYLPEYVYAVGGLDQQYSIEELRARGRITDRAIAADRSAAFSDAIRVGVPGAHRDLDQKP